MMSESAYGAAAPVEVPLQDSFEVALQGSFGPALQAAFAAMGVRRIRTTSSFLLPVRDGEGICEIIEDLGRRGMLILDVRPAAAGVVAPRDGHPLTRASSGGRRALQPVELPDGPSLRLTQVRLGRDQPGGSSDDALGHQDGSGEDEPLAPSRRRP
jgi:hypothetical protein